MYKVRSECTSFTSWIDTFIIMKVVIDFLIEFYFHLLCIEA